MTRRTEKDADFDGRHHTGVQGAQLQPPAETNDDSDATQPADAHQQPPDQGGGRITYTVAEAALLTGISRELLYDQMRRGRLGYVKVGRRRLVTRRHLQQFLGEAS